MGNKLAASPKKEMVFDSLTKLYQDGLDAKPKNVKVLDIHPDQDKFIVFSDKEFLDISKDHALNELVNLLGLGKFPQRIEGYDISHQQGSDDMSSAFAQDQSCSQCLAFAQLSGPLISAPPDFILPQQPRFANARANGHVFQPSQERLVRGRPF